MAGLLDVRVTPTMQCLEDSNRDCIPALAHPVFRVAVLSDSPVVWSCRKLNLNKNLIVSVTGVTWPVYLTYVSPLPCSE